MRIKEIIGILRSFDLQMNSPRQFQKTHIEKSMQNMDTDVRVLRVNKLGNELKVLQSNQRQMNDQKQSSNSLTLIEQGMFIILCNCLPPHYFGKNDVQVQLGSHIRQKAECFGECFNFFLPQ